MTKVLLVLHTLPLYGGGEVQAQYLKNHFSGKKGYYIYDYSRHNHSRARWDSFLDFRAILAGVWWEIKVIFLLFHKRPDKICFTLPKSYMAFMRNAMVIPFAKLSGTKVLGVLLGTSFLFLDKGYGLNYNLGLFFLRKIDEIRFLSPGISESHLKYKLQKHVIIENGIHHDGKSFIDPDAFKSEVLNLVYVGAIERSKGIFNSLQALRICNEAGYKLHFHIIGSLSKRAEENEVMNFIQQNKLNDLVSFHGVLTGDSKWKILRDCAVLVHPTYWDGVPLTILEALSSGMPVISTNVGGIPDTIKDGINGTILSENNPELLSKAISYYYNNRHILSVISEENKILFRKRFNLHIYLQNMENWFAE